MARVLGQLTIREDSIGVDGAGEHVIIEDLDALHEFVREDALGRYRPLSGARTLRAGWTAPLPDTAQMDAAIETVYPLALVHQRQFAAGTLRVVSLDAVLERQSGRYESASALDAAGREAAVHTVCGECVRRPVWDSAPCAPGDIPCPEPCSVLVAFCREAVVWHEQRPAPAAVDFTVPWAAFDQPGNELRERYLQETNPKR